MTTQKISVTIRQNDKGEPTHGLFRINQYWVWCLISLLSEDEAIELLESRQSIKTNAGKE